MLSVCQSTLTSFNVHAVQQIQSGICQHLKEVSHLGLEKKILEKLPSFPRPRSLRKWSLHVSATQRAAGESAREKKMKVEK